MAIIAVIVAIALLSATSTGLVYPYNGLRFNDYFELISDGSLTIVSCPFISQSDVYRFVISTNEFKFVNRVNTFRLHNYTPSADQGMYMCINADRILYKYYIDQHLLQDRTYRLRISEGTDINIPCTNLDYYNGSPPTPTAKWMYIDRTDILHPVSHSTSNTMLRIRNISVHDTGSYMCENNLNEYHMFK